MERSSCRIVLLCTLLIGYPVFAQQETGTIIGTVTAEGGETLPGVTVGARGKYLFGERSSVTDENGRYRLGNLPVGGYDVSFVMPGFKTVKHKDLKVALGQSRNLSVELGVSSVQEVLTVTSSEPLIDTSNANQGQSFNLESLETLPTTKDPWSVLELTPGVYLGQSNVGGNKQGTQARFGANGTSPYQNAYYVDGINMTDTSASGASGQYYDYDTFDAIQISTAAHDPSVGAPGVNVTMVTKTGSNQLEAKAGFGYSSESWQSKNSVLQGEEILNTPQDYNKDLNVNIRGPIIKDKLWFFIAHHQNKVNLYTPNTRDSDNPLTDLTELEQTNANFKWAISTGNTFKVSVNENNKKKSNRLPGYPDSSYYQGKGLGWKQNGPGDAWQVQDEWFVSDALNFSFKYGKQSFPFTLGIPDDAPEDVLDRYPVHLNDDEGTATSAYTYPEYDRQNETYSARANYFKTLGSTSHDMSFGADLVSSENLTKEIYPGNAIVKQENTSVGQVWFYRPVFTTNQTENISAYVNDVVSFNKWTFNLGLRYQVQKGSIDAGRVEGTWQNVPSEPGVIDGVTFAQRFATVSAPELKNAAKWTNLLPRVMVSYDLKADGRMLFKLGLNQYAHTMNNDEFELASALATLEEDYAWIDKNEDGMWYGDGRDWEEIDFTDRTFSAGAAGGTTIDDGYAAPLTDEVIFNVSHQFQNKTAISGTFIYRNTHNMTYTRKVGAAGLENWQETTFEDDQGTNHVAYNFIGDTNTTDLRTNLNNYESAYRGFELTASKRGENFSLNASYTLGSTDLSYDLNELNDPNNAETLGSGRSFSNDYAAKNSARVYGSYNLPWKLQLSGKMIYDSGRYYNQFQRRADGFTTVDFLTHGRETDHLPSYVTLDLGLGRTFKAGDAGSFEVKLDVYNVFNENTEIGYVSSNINSSSFLSIGEILGPRIARINVSYIY